VSTKTAGPHGPAVFGDRCSTLCVADRSPTPLTTAACGVTVSVAVSGATFRWLAVRLAEPPVLLWPQMHVLRWARGARVVFALPCHDTCQSLRRDMPIHVER